MALEILRDARCSECGAGLERGGFLLVEAGQPLCLPCARPGDLECLPAGDPALTRRAAKYSGRSTVVVRFSRSRKRYERQGMLVEAEALEKAEQECALDSGERARERARAAAARAEEDRKLTARMAERILALFHGCPPPEAAEIAGHAAVRGSGRAGRTAAGQALDEQAAAAAVRHRHTGYDALVLSGCDRAMARERVAGRVREILAAWRESG